MNYLEAALLGLIQGITEFLPVSSSGHLELAKAIFGKDIEEGLLLSRNLFPTRPTFFLAIPSKSNPTTVNFYNPFWKKT